MGRARRTAVVAVGAATLLLAACSGGDPDRAAQRPVTGTTSSAEPTMPLDGDVPPGTYRMPASGWSVAPYSITLGPGWRVQYGHVFVRNQDSDTELGLYTVVVENIYEDACGDSEQTRPVLPGTEALVDALSRQPGPEVSTPVAATLGAHAATRIDLSVPDTLDLGTCRLARDGVDGLQVWYSAPADKYFVLLPGGTATAYVLDLAGGRQVVLSQQHDASPAADVAALQAALDSIRFEG